jgi:roadblock/LC7 domain-containing protein
MTNNEYEKIIGKSLGPIDLYMAGRRSGKSNTQVAMVEYLRQQTEYIRECKSKGYTSIYIEHGQRKEMIDWCVKNCTNHFCVVGQLFVFEKEDDAMAFALVW